MKYSVFACGLAAMLLQPVHAAVMNFQVSPFHASLAQFERVVANSNDGIISIDSLAEKPDAMQYQVGFDTLKISNDTGIQAFDWDGDSYFYRSASFTGINQIGDQGLQFFCNYLAYSASQCDFSNGQSSLELSLNRQQKADGTVSDSVSATIRYERTLVNSTTSDGITTTNSQLYRRSFLFHGNSTWGVTLPDQKTLLNWLAVNAQGNQVSEQMVISNRICADTDCSSDSVNYSLLIPGRNTWQVETVSSPASATIFILGLAGLCARRQRRFH